VLSVISMVVSLVPPIAPVIAPVKEAQAATRLGLHVTREEVWCWRQRAGLDPQGANGITCPVMYKSLGDIPGQPYSPGEWDRIVQQSNLTLSNYRWAGWTGAGCIPAETISDPQLILGDPIMAAAFRYLVTGDTGMRDKVVTELVAQAQVPGVDFGNSAKFCPTVIGGYNWSDNDRQFRTAMWLTRLIYLLAGNQYHGYTTSQANKDIIQGWFADAAAHFHQTYTTSLTAIFSNRANQEPGSYSFTGEGSTNCAANYSIPPYYGGPVVKGLGVWINNRRALSATVFGLIGVQQNNPIWKAEAVKAIKEYLIYGVGVNRTKVRKVSQLFEYHI
jgi:hypothetical protein